MARPMPHFVRGGTVNAVAEYTEFANDVGDAAAHLLAELVFVQSDGNVADLPRADREATAIRELYCRLTDGWAVSTPLNRLAIIVKSRSHMWDA